MLDVVLTDTRDVLGVIGPVLYDEGVQVRMVTGMKTPAGLVSLAVALTPATEDVLGKVAAALGVPEPNRIVSSDQEGGRWVAWSLHLPDTQITITTTVRAVQ